jgi:hypothetical protein
MSTFDMIDLDNDSVWVNVKKDKSPSLPSPTYTVSVLVRLQNGGTLNRTVKTSDGSLHNLPQYIEDTLASMYNEYINTHRAVRFGFGHKKVQPSDVPLHVDTSTTTSTTARLVVDKSNFTSTTGIYTGTNWQDHLTTTPASDSIADFVATDEMKKLREENTKLREVNKGLLEIVNNSPAGDIAFGRGYKSMTMMEVEDEIKDKVARYKDQGLTLKRFVFLSQEPLYVDRILGVEVFTAIPYNEDVITLKDLRDAATKLNKLVGGSGSVGTP